MRKIETPKQQPMKSSSDIDHENSPWLDDHQSSFNLELLGETIETKKVRAEQDVCNADFAYNDQVCVNTPDLESTLNKQEYLHDPVPNSKIEI